MYVVDIYIFVLQKELINIVIIKCMEFAKKSL